MAPVPPPPPDVPPPDGPLSPGDGGPGGPADPLAEFLRRATPILTRERGLGGRSRMLLQAVARDLGLSDAAFQDAIRRLQQSTAPPDVAKAHPGMAAFETWLGLNLRQIPQKILTPPLEQRVYKIGTDDFRLPGDVIAAALTRSLAEAGVRRIGTEQSQAHLAQVIERRLMGARHVSEAQLTDILEQGRRVGLAPADVERLVVHQIGLNTQARKQARTTRTLAGAAIGISVLAALGLVLLVIFRPGSSPVAVTPPPGGPADPAPGPGTPPVGPPTPVPTPATDLTDRPAWWDETLIIATREAGRMKGFGGLGRSIKEIDPSRRATAYADLARWIDQSWSGDRSDQTLEDLAVGILTREQDAAAHEAFADAVSAVLRRRLDFDADGDVVAAAEGALAWTDAIGRALKRLPPGAVQRPVVLSAFEQAADRTVATALEGPDPARELAAVTYARLMATLGAAQAATPDAPRFDQIRQLRARVQGRVTGPAVDAATAEFLYRALLPASASPADYTLMINEVLQREDPAAAIRLVELMEQTDSDAVRRSLINTLTIDFNLPVGTESLLEVSAAVRKALGIAPSSDLVVRQRWATFDGALAAAGGPTAGPVRGGAAVARTAELARLAGMAAALVRGEADPSVFDRLATLGAASEKAPGDAAPGAAGPAPRGASLVMSGSAQRTYDEALGVLRMAPTPASGKVRRNAMMRFVGVAADVPRLPAADASILAVYLLSRKDADEQAYAVDQIDAIAQFPELVLALVDQLDRISAFDAAQSQEIVVALLDKPMSLASPQGIQAAQAALLDRAEAMVSGALARRGTRDPSGGSAERLTQAYRLRVEALGGTPPAGDAATPDALTQAALDAVRGRLTADAVAAEDRAAFETLAIRPAAAAAFPERDVARLVLLQRSLVDAVGLTVAGADPARRAAARALRAENAARQATQPDAAAQLAVGEETLLKLWLLARPEEMKARA